MLLEIKNTVKMCIIQLSHVAMVSLTDLKSTENWLVEKFISFGAKSIFRPDWFWQ